MLVSGGAGDCNICITDCVQGQTVQALSGHTGEKKDDVKDAMYVRLSSQFCQAKHNSLPNVNTPMPPCHVSHIL